MLNFEAFYGLRPAMEIQSFHRGAHAWVAQWTFDGRDRVAYYDRELGRWLYSGMERIDPATRADIDDELTINLREHLKRIGLLTE